MIPHTYKLGKTNKNPRIKSKAAFFSSFMFTDQMTHNSINVQEMHDQMFKKDRKQASQLSTQFNLSQCVNMLKSARKFQIESLQSKNYNTKTKTTPDNTIVQQTIMDSYQEKLKHQYYVRKDQQRKQYSMDKENLKKYLNKEPVEVKSIKNKVQKRKKVEKLKREENPAQVYMKKGYEEDKKDEREESKNKERELIEDFENQINYTVKKNSQFLINPHPKKLFYVKRAKVPHQRKTTPLQYKTDLSDYSFTHQEVDLSNNTPKIGQNFLGSSHVDSHLLEEKKKILKTIGQGQFFRVQIQLSINPNLLQTRDKKNNNLLHLSVLNNNEELFEMILKKCIENNKDYLLFEKNKFQRTPVEMIQIFGSFTKQSLIDQIAKVYVKNRVSLLQPTIKKLFQKNFRF